MSTQYKELDALGYPNYKVGDDGSVWAFRSHDCPPHGRQWRWKRLKQATDPAGRKIVSLCNGRTKNFFVHYLVLVMFVGPRPKGMTARHFPDRDPANNAQTNLSWASQKINQRDRLGHGTDLRGEKHPFALHTNARVRRIRKLHQRGHTIHEIANRFNARYQNIWGIVKNRTYLNA